jgi:two-component system phosphate regulon sensor histidine kinase PhoR
MLQLGRTCKLHLVYILVLVVSITAAGFILEDKLKRRLTQHMQEDIRVRMALVARALPSTEAPDVLDAFCVSYGRSAGVRITVIDRQGRVIGESERPSAGMENHLQRPEIQAAMQTGSGMAWRYSATLRLKMFYLAQRLEAEGRILRLAIPAKRMRQIQNEVMGVLAGVLFFIPFVTSVVAFIFVRYMETGR